MAELATIARPYAEALFQSITSDADQTIKWLDELAHIAGDASFREFAGSPKVSPDQIFDVLQKVMNADFPIEVGNFLRLVIQNGRLAAIQEIAAQFRVLRNAQSGVIDAVVHSAFDIEPPALNELAELLERRFGQKLNLSVQLAPELIGGIRVNVGDEVLDTSILARLEQMKVALTA